MDARLTEEQRFLHDSAERIAAARVAKAACGEEARFVTEASLQLLGGVGFTCLPRSSAL